jgi:CheY-like chemotaxis protein
LIVPTILVADDNSNIQKMVSLVFKEKGIRVVAVGNGEAACRKVPEVQPDVVLADVFMPVRNGYEVCEFVKQDPQFAETPVILLVGAFDPLDEKEAQRVGANGVLKKPFVPPEPLIALVSSLLGKTEPPPVEQAPAPAEIALAPLAPPPTREFVAAPASTDYEDQADETVSTFSDPVATPSAKGQDAEEEQEDDSEPASEWARRRAAMDYEIDSADSANMVEKLAAQDTVEDPQILASNKQLPFGGANLPEMLSEPTVESRAAKWARLTEPEATAPAGEVSAPEIAAPEISVPVETATPTSFEDTSSRYQGDFGSAPPELRPAEEIEVQTPQVEPEPERAPAPTTPWAVAPAAEEAAAPTRDAVGQAASASWPLPHANRESEESSPALDAVAVEQPDPSDAAPRSSEERSGWLAAPEPPLALPEAVSYATPVPIAGPPQEVAPAAEVPAEEPSAKALIDQATVDEVVAKVISRLEPQLHRALANGVLRPLIEEVLNQQRDKK